MVGKVLAILAPILNYGGMRRGWPLVGSLYAGTTLQEFWDSVGAPHTDFVGDTLTLANFKWWKGITYSQILVYLD